MKFSWTNTPKPIVALAPMEGYTDSPFRQIVKEIAPKSICFTEFSSADAIAYGAERVLKKVGFTPVESPLIVQIFGNKSDSFAKAVQTIAATGIGGIDINMGCPAAKIVASEHGSALMKDPAQAVELVKTIKANTDLPVSVKTRLGYHNADQDHFFSFCEALIKAGASCLTIHGRTTKQRFSGEANWQMIYELKNRFPETTIIGNGDITSGQDALDKINNLDGIMVGRAAFGNPWVIQEVVAALHGFDYTPPQTLAEKIPTIISHCEKAIAWREERLAMVELRKQLAAYMKSFPGASKIRQQLVQVISLQEVKDILATVPADL